MQPNERMPPQLPPQSDAERHYLLAWRLFFVAAGLIVVSAFLPWVTALAIIQAHLPGGDVLLVLVVGALYAGAGYMVRERRITHTLIGALWILNGAVAVGVVLIFKAAGGLGNELVSPAAGVFVCGFGVIAGTAATIQVHRAGDPLPRLLARLVAAVRLRETALSKTVARQSSQPPPPPPISLESSSEPASVPAQVFCDNCGNPMAPTQRFCSVCGTRQKGVD